MVIRRVGVGSAAKIGGALYAVIGLIIGLFVAAFSLVDAGLASQAGTGDVPSFIGPLLGVGAIVVAPIFYGILGAIGAAVMAAVYHLVAGMTGGLQLEVE
ncbi:MAG: hypothetical protein ABIX28_23315 [Vicinamibacterales bacterium]